MSYENTKVYFDGSHYIGIPYKPSTAKRGAKTPEETVVVEDQNTSAGQRSAVNADVVDNVPNTHTDSITEPRKGSRITRKALFENVRQGGEKRA